MNESIDPTFLRQRFMAKLGKKADVYPKALEEQFPRILARIIDLWGEPEMDRYFAELTTTTRADRQGFPEEVAFELFRLSNLHSSFGLEGGGKRDPWNWGNDSEYFKRGL